MWTLIIYLAVAAMLVADLIMRVPRKRRVVTDYVLAAFWPLFAVFMAVAGVVFVVMWATTRISMRKLPPLKSDPIEIDESELREPTP